MVAGTTAAILDHEETWDWKFHAKNEKQKEPRFTMMGYHLLVLAYSPLDTFEMK